MARSRGDFDSSEVFLTRGIAIGQEMGDRWCVARCLNALGVVSTRRGDMEAAARQLGEALNVFVEMELLPDIARCTAGLGYLDLARGDVSGARRRLSSCLRLSVASGRRLAVARALEALGGLAAAEEQPERAASLAGAGAALRASLGLSAPHAEAVRAEAAAVLSEEAAEQAWNAWRALPLEQVVERALYFPTPRRALPSLLTRREKEISVLVSKGLSNREIADRLTISQATVARHIANIFRKLLFTSRTQLAEWVQRNGLAPDPHRAARPGAHRAYARTPRDSAGSPPIPPYRLHDRGPPTKNRAQSPADDRHGTHRTPAERPPAPRAPRPGTCRTRSPRPSDPQLTPLPSGKVRAAPDRLIA
ncbi:LuxR C-terminal-related transcriptional regulator [Nocardiopsis composta]